MAAFQSRTLRSNHPNEFAKLQQEIAVLRGALRHNQSVATPEDQEALITRIKESINPPPPPTLRELFIQWQEANKDRMVETSHEKSYKPAIDLFIRFVDDFAGDAVRLNDLKPDHIRYYQKHYQAIPKETYTADYSIAKLIPAQSAENHFA